MTDMNEPDQGQNQSTENRTSTSEAWQEVGRQFKLLGESISQAFQAAWHDEENRRRMEELRSGLESMVSDVSSTIKQAANTPQTQHIRDQGRQAAQDLRSASEQTVQDIRPHLVNTLRQLNQELQKLADRMDKPASPVDLGSNSDKTDNPPE